MAVGNTPLGRLVVDLDLNTSSLNNSVSGLQRQMRMVNSAMRANLSEIGKYGSESDKAAVKIDALTKKQKVQEAIVEETRNTYAKLVRERGEASKEAKKEREALDKLIKEQGENSDAAREQALVLEEVIQKTGASSKEAEAYASKLNKEEAALSGVTAELKELSREQEIANSNWTKLGDSLDSAGSKMTSFGNGAQKVGGKLTRYITTPVAGAITAVGGLVAAFGWGRLQALDAAQTQLKGLGYDIEGVERISEQVRDAVQGTTMTMAEGTSIAAGALAAGIDEGEELEHYIKTIGNAAVGANRPVADMATIFNRVQGTGKLMTEELNMIEDGMPGFSKAMSKHMGVSMQEFRKMVTEGEVSSGDFITVMDDFAGDMSEAYSKSWAGMLSNTKAWIGILGENLLSGVFEHSKESVAEFLELLKSDSLQKWAKETGLAIGRGFGRAIETLKGVISWFSNLSTEQKKIGVAIAGAVVAAGPLLLVFGKIMTVAGKITSALAPLSRMIARNGGLLKTLRIAFLALTSPVGLIVTAVAVLTAGFVYAYRNSESFRDAIHGVGRKIREVWDYLKEFGTGVINLFKGSDKEGKNILSSLGVTDDNIEKIMGFRDNIIELKDKVLELGSSILSKVKPALEEVMGFIGEVGTTLSGMWQENSSTIIPVVTTIGNIISGVFNGILSVIDFVMPAVFKIIEMVWKNIKGVVEGGLKVIDGVIKLFSGLFTGDFSKMWEGIKKIFSGAIQVVWNGFQLMFYGRLIKGVVGLVKAFSGHIRNLWTRVVEFFKNMVDGAASRVSAMRDSVGNIISNMRTKVITTVINLYNSIKSRFTNIKDSVTNIASNLRTSVTNTFNGLRTLVTNTVTRLYNSVKNTFTNTYNSVKDTVTNLRTNISNLFTRLRTSVSDTVRNLYNSIKNNFNNIFSSVKGIIKNLRDDVIDRFNNVRERITSSVTTMKNSVTRLFTNMKDNATKMLDNIISGAKKLPGKIADGIRNGRNKATDAVKSLGNGMIGQLENVVNGMVGGMNNVLEKLGIKNLIGRISIPRFSRGTAGGGSEVRNGAIARSTLATVGDKGAGNGSGTRELVQYPNGLTGLYDNDATIFAPKGTIIYNNKQTEQMLSGLPQFSRGTRPNTGVGSGTNNSGSKKEKKGAWGSFKDLMANTWNYIRNPKKAFDAIIENIGSKISGLSGFANTAATGGFNLVKDSALNWVTSIFKRNEGGEIKGDSILKKSISAPFGFYPVHIANALGVSRHYGLDTRHYYEKLTSPVTGKVTNVWNDRLGGNAIQIKAGDLTWWFMHMQSIARRIGDSVKAGKTNLGKTGNTGLRTTGAHLHTQAMKGGIGNRFAVNPLPILRKAGGYATGGLIKQAGLYNLAEEGYPEFIIPTDPSRRTDAMKLLAHAGKALQKNSGNLRPNNLPNINSNNSDIESLKEIVKQQQSQIEQNNQMLAFLATIAEKDYVAVFNEKKLAKELEPELTKRIKYNEKREARFT